MLRPFRDHLYRIRTQVLCEPLNRGRRLHYLWNYLRWFGGARYGTKPWTVTFENGMRSLVMPHPDQNAGELNIWTRNNDFHDTELVRRILKPGDHIVDAGCNVGNRTWALADLLGGALLIDAGEVAVRRTRQHLVLNGLDPKRYIILHKAVGAEAGVVRFTDLGGASTLNRALAHGEQSVEPTVEVAVTTIDAEVAALGWRPTYIKIDVEGHDLAALRGAWNTLRGGSVRLVKFERLASEPLAAFTDLFDELGWTVFALHRDRIVRDPDALAHTLNLFAAPPETVRSLVG